MSQHSGGTKRSSLFTFRRRLLLIRLLLRGPQTSQDMIEAIHKALGDEGYPQAAAAALKHDLDALKGEYGCVIRFQRTAKHYVLEDIGDLALLDLPDHCMEALAFLDSSFPAGSALPEHANIRALIEQVSALLPPARRASLAQPRNFSLALQNGSANRLHPPTLAMVRRATTQRQELQFIYQSLNDDTPRLHRVAPYGVFFRAEGHAYLDATLLEVSPGTPEDKHAAIHYRLDRIVPGSAQVLPQMLPPTRPAPRSYQVRYHLLPAVARRRDVATYFPSTVITYHEDGSATVEAQVTNLWQARQTLLRYGNACLVEQPTELVALFRETTKGLIAHYLGEEGFYRKGESAGD